MSPEDLNNEIRLIFARACAEGLKGHVSAILDLEDRDQSRGLAANYGEAFASAYAYIFERFTTGLESSRPLPSWHQAQGEKGAPNNSFATDAQQRAKQIHQALGVLLGIEEVSLGSGPQQ